MKIFSGKAIIEVQIGWIFALIAGLVIFAFIVSLALNQQSHANDALNIDVGEKLTTSIKGNLQVSNSYNEIILLSPAKLSFACDSDLKATTMRVNNAPIAERFSDVIFAPAVLNTNKLQVGVQDFSLAFIISRFAYITAPDTIYLIYYGAPATPEESLAQQLYDILPSNTSKRMVFKAADLSTAVSQYKNYKIICFNKVCPNNYDYINVDAINNFLDGYGNVTWHNANTKSPFLTSSSLLGAVFSDSKEYYECEMQRAFNILEIKRELQFNRLSLMTPDLNQYNFQCVALLAEHEFILNDMKNMGLSNTTALYDDTVKLRQANLDSGFMGCPKVT